MSDFRTCKLGELGLKEGLKVAAKRTTGQKDDQIVVSKSAAHSGDDNLKD